MKILLNAIAFIFNTIAMFLVLVGIFAIFVVLTTEPDLIADVLTVARCEMNLGCPLDYRAEQLLNSLFK